MTTDEKIKLLDHFAGLAMQGFLVTRDTERYCVDGLADDAYHQAESMMRARAEQMRHGVIDRILSYDPLDP